MPMPQPIRSSQHGPPLAAERERFDRDGYLVIRDALTPGETGFYRDALDRVYAAAQADRRIPPGGPLHQLSAVAACPQAAGLLDHPATFGYVWPVLGWNIHVYHSHLDVHPTLPARRRAVRPAAVARPLGQPLAAYPARRCSSATPTGGSRSATRIKRSGPATWPADSAPSSGSFSAACRTPTATTPRATTSRPPRCTAG
jgi:hypothetical protein